MTETQRILIQVRELLQSFETSVESVSVREKVTALVPAFDAIRELGKSLIPNGLSLSARDRLLAYFLLYPRCVLREKELAIVAGISEWARRVRELRVQHGWRIVTGVTVGQMIAVGDLEDLGIGDASLSVNDYMLADNNQDRDAAYRWNIANEIRRGSQGGQDKILKYLRANLGKPVSGEELSYVAQSSEWARRVRELRTEQGWPISTKMSGNPSLPVGVYVLERDRQAPSHDRRIPDGVRRQVLQRDGYACRNCGWSHDMWNASDPRFLELHHVIHHAHGGLNESDNLVTYCNVCHDELHKREKSG
ncbi:MAG: HNH endonuclease [Spirochaetaceae bacterium]|nr:MAG: HNH endonuclease [Spirochaetaceae bacterium]